MNVRVVGWLLVALQFALLAALVFLPWNPHGPIWVTLGGLTIIAAAVLGVSAFANLGNALTPTPVPLDGISLRTKGAYRWVRHPIYSALLLMVIGANIAAGTPLTVMAAVVLLLFFLAKSQWEDTLLRDRFGKIWEDWAIRTGALAPTIGRWRG